MALFLLLFTVLLTTASGDDPFESLLVRLNCYDYAQPGCNQTFVNAYPELAWSANNLTKADTFFFMFTNKRRDNPELMHECAGELPPDTTFNPDCRTEVVIPGFLSGICNMAIFREIKNERLKSGCYNVLLVDWMWGCSFDLRDCLDNIKIVVAQLVVVIEKLKKRYCLNAEHFILTGHSFGAHTAGIVGQHTPISIINGLEPSGVMFTENTPKDERLDPGDAQCVQVFHTNAGECLPNYFGANFSCGTFDVYFNGGLNQTDQCRIQEFKSTMKGDYIYAFFTLYPAACSHYQSLQYYKASINPTDCQLTGVACQSLEDFNAGNCNNCKRLPNKYLSVGAYGCDCYKRKCHTNYFLNTTLQCPFCDDKDDKQKADRCGSKPTSFKNVHDKCRIKCTKEKGRK